MTTISEFMKYQYKRVRLLFEVYPNICQRMVRNQEKQGRMPNRYVFFKDFSSPNPGFLWKDSVEGDNFWQYIEARIFDENLSDKDFLKEVLILRHDLIISESESEEMLNNFSQYIKKEILGKFDIPAYEKFVRSINFRKLLTDGKSGI